VSAVAYNEIRGRVVNMGERARTMLGEPGKDVVWAEFIDWSLFE
jgi:hypothetical protein